MRVPPLLLLVAVLFLAGGCLTNRHTIGDGPQGFSVDTYTTWYTAWGLLPLNAVDSRTVVGSARDYRLTHEIDGWDCFLNLFTMPFSFYRTTTTVEK